MGNPILDARKLGQSIWYDNIRRGLITSGELRNMVEQDGLLGVTSNPAIFEKALGGSKDYDEATKELVKGGAGDAKELYERLAIEDIGMAADVLRPVYDKTGGVDGYVSFEVSPYLARDTSGTLEEARRLRAAIARDNVMIKVPATPEGVPAIRALIADGTNVNVTLLFAVEAYAAVAEAFMQGLEERVAKGEDISRTHSVASFFVSRIDSLVDDRVSRALDATQDAALRDKLKGLLGKVAIANAVLAYERYKTISASPRWKALAAKGAHPQRLLWASTSTKNPKYAKTMYIDSLIGPDTVNTLPAETFNELRSKPGVSAGLVDDWDRTLAAAKATMTALEAAGISMKEVTDTLLADGITKFSEPFDKLLGAVERKRQTLLGESLDRQTWSIGDAGKDLEVAIEDWRANGKIRRLWKGDTTLWTGKDEQSWLGWLHVISEQLGNPEPLARLAEDVRASGFQHAVVLGMGGSSLCPDVLRATFGKAAGYPELLVLDSTVPSQVRAIERKVDPAKTLFIVSSKSGSTTEPNVFFAYFLAKVRAAVGNDRAGQQFIAITDPGSDLHKVAKQERLRHIFHGVPSIGGRYSALSNFGMVPAAAMGLDTTDFLDRAEVMAQACASSVPPEVNPGVQLGLLLGTLAKRGRDKVTIVASPGIATLGAWLEQLIAESSGKEGGGLVPVADEMLGAPGTYGADRVFAYVRLAKSPSSEQDAAIDALERAGHPVVRITIDDPRDLGQEFFRWEIATAVACSVLGINAFNQPDVEAAKIATKRITKAFEDSGALPKSEPFAAEGNLSLFADPKNAVDLGVTRSVEALLRAHLDRIRPGDYFAINAYVEMSPENDRHLQAMREVVRASKRVATTLGYGPRFLHSTGQLHKGGPASGIFLQITADDAESLPIPDKPYDFGVLVAAQALGDLEVLVERGRRVVRVHIEGGAARGLERLGAILGRGVV